MQSLTTLQNTTNKPNPASWHRHTSNTTYRNNVKPTKSIKNQDFEERRLKGLCFWCDDKFVLVHKCRSKMLYSLSVIEEEDEVITKEQMGDDF